MNPSLIGFDKNRLLLAFTFAANLILSKASEVEIRVALEQLKETDEQLLFLVSAVLQEINRNFTNKVQA